LFVQDSAWVSSPASLVELLGFDSLNCIMQVNASKCKYDFCKREIFILNWAVAIDPRIAEMMSLMEELSWLPANLHQRLVATFPEHQGIALSSVTRFLNGQVARPSKPWVSDAISLLKREKERKFSTSVTIPGNMQTSVYYNSEKDSARNIQDLAASLSLPQNVLASVISPGAPWSAKNVATRMIIVSAFPGAAGVGPVVQIDGKLGEHLPGSIFFFKETAYPTPGIILLFEGQDDPDQKLIGVIEGSKIVSEGMINELSDWKVTHFAFAKGWGTGDQISNGNWSSAGIGLR
jgi:hypothetical protein